MIKLKDVLPLIQQNDIQLLNSNSVEICLLRQDFILVSLSDNIQNMPVNSIYMDEDTPDTIFIVLGSNI